MKIDHAYQPSLTPLTGRNKTGNANVQESESDAVSVSSLASTLQSGEQPPVNAQRIQEIKDAISQGRFTINTEAIADSLISSARDLIASQRQA